MDDLENKITRIRTWHRSNERAVHKPLLVLLAISRVLHGLPRFSLFDELEAPLADLLKRFGRPAKLVHPEYPFWRLQNDGLWEVRADIDIQDLVLRQNQTDPKKSQLREHNARGGFAEEIFVYLARFPQQAISLVEVILKHNFAGVEHEELRQMTELPHSISELSHLQRIQLSELAARAEPSPTSTRLKNALNVAKGNERLTIQTIADYIQDPEPDVQLLCLPAVGRKCVALLRELVSDFLHKDALRRNVDSYVAQQGRNNVVESNDSVNGASGSPLDTCPTPSLRDNIWSAIESFSKESALEVLKLRFAERQTLEEVGHSLGVTRERIRQIQKREIRKLSGHFYDELAGFAHKLDDLLDEQLGVISHANFSAITGCLRDDIDLMLAMLAHSLKEPIKNDRMSMIYRRSTDAWWPEWTTAVLDVVSSSPWPIRIEYLLRSLEGIPSAFVGHVLRERLGATLAGGRVVKITRASESQKFVFCLRALGRHAHVDEIAHIYKELFDELVLPRNAGAALQRLGEALIVNRGEYCLYEHLWFDDDEVAAIANECIGYLKTKKHYVSTAVICHDLFKNRYPSDKMNKYVLLGIMQDDDRFVTRRGFMIALVSRAQDLEFRSLDTAVFKTVQKHGPIGIADIRRRLENRRYLLDVTISMALGKDPRILKLPGRVFELSDRIFSESMPRADVEDAIRICLLNGPRTTFAVVSMLKSNGPIRDLGIGPELVSSLSYHMHDVERIGDRLSLLQVPQDLAAYRDFSSNSGQSDSRATAIEPEIADADPIFGKYAALDCRAEYISTDKSSSPESIQSILDSFGEL